MKFRPGPGAVTAAALLAVVVTFGVFGQRLASAVAAPDFGTVYDHPDAIYGIWKVQHGRPLYEECRSGDYVIELFNFGFYTLYGKVLGALGIIDAGVLRWGKFLSLSLITLGAGGQLLTLRALLGPAGWRRWWPAALAAVLLFWFGFTNWFAFSVRADIPALAATAWGLFAYVRFAARGPGGRPGLAALVVCSLIFTAAWSCKQVCVWSFSGLVLFELVAGGGGSLRRALALATPFSLLVGLAFVIGGRVYFDNVIVAPGSQPAYRPILILQQSVKAGLAYPFAFGFAALGIGLFAREILARWRGGQSLRAALSADRTRAALMTVAAVATTMNLLSFGRAGALREHIFEAALTLTTLAVWTLADLAGEPGAGRTRWAAVATFAGTGLLPLTQLLAYGGLSGVIGRLHADFVPRPPTLYARPDDYARIQAFNGFLRTLPGPIFSFGVLSLPWLTNDPAAPALIVLPDAHEAMAERGLLRGGGWRDFYRQRRVGSLLLERSASADLAAAEACGYRQVPVPAEIDMAPFTGRAFSVVGSRDTVVLVRAADPGANQSPR